MRFFVYLEDLLQNKVLKISWTYGLQSRRKKEKEGEGEEEEILVTEDIWPSDVVEVFRRIKINLKFYR